MYNFNVLDTISMSCGCNIQTDVSSMSLFA